MATRNAPKVKQMSSNDLRTLVGQKNKYSWKAAAELTRRGHSLES